MAEEIRILLVRVAVDGCEQYIVAVVEDRLCAIAVVVIDIENGHFAGTLVAQVLRGDRDVVEVAVTAEVTTDVPSPVK